MGGLLLQVLQERALPQSRQNTRTGHPDMTMESIDIVTRLREIAIEERPFWRSAMMEAAGEIERLRVLLKLFDNYYICENCADLSATYLENCQNPLHQLHDAAWKIES